MLHKSFDILEAKTDAEAGTFEALVAVFGNVDKGGDRIQPGAFKNTLAKWQASGDPIPVILSHQWDNPMAHIGVVEEAKETDRGLYVKGTLDVKDNDVARQVHRLMKRRSLKEFSFGYSVPQGGQKRAKDGAMDLSEIDLAEVGPTLKGMNPATELHAVKSAIEAETKADGMAGVMQRMRSLLDQQEAPTAEQMLAFARSVISELGPKSDSGETHSETEPGRSTHSDPLRKQAEAVALEVASGGMSLRKPPAHVEEPTPELIPLEELKARTRDVMLQVMTGMEIT